VRSSVETEQTVAAQAHISTLDVVVIMSVSGLHVNSTYLR